MLDRSKHSRFWTLFCLFMVTVAVNGQDWASQVMNKRQTSLSSNLKLEQGLLPEVSSIPVRNKTLEIYGCSANTVPSELPFFCRLERKMDTHFKRFDVRIRLK